jgi:tetratricopeptide (TPR) repeat protein
MKRLFWILLLQLASLAVTAQETDPVKLQETGRTFMKTGDYNNALMVFNRALELKPNDLSLLKDIAYTNYLKRDFTKGLEVAKPLVDRDDADVQTFLITGNLYKATEQLKDGEKMYRKGVKRFPESGAIRAELGDIMWLQKNSDAILEWEKGIEVDPNYAGNYYHAARYYYLTTNRVWTLLYGEIFINLESYTSRTAEIKLVLLDGYKKLYSKDPKLSKTNKKPGEFEKAFLEVMNSQESLTDKGITMESLTMIRTRYVIDWFQKYATKYPYRLFDHWQQLMRGGLFEAYDQWVFGASIDPVQNQRWNETHTVQVEAYKKLQGNRVFKIPANQYYQTK